MDFIGKKFHYLFSPFRDKCCAMIDVISHLKRQNMCFLQRVKIPVLTLSILLKEKNERKKQQIFRCRKKEKTKTKEAFVGGQTNLFWLYVVIVVGMLME